MEFMYLVPIAFICELVDSTLGMGYGTILTPILLIMGFDPLQVIPCVLLSELFTGSLAAYAHHRAHNVSFTVDSKDTKIALILSIFALVGIAIATFMVINIPKDSLRIIIGVIVTSMSVFMVATLNKSFKLSWIGICSIGAIASFNKGASGGGYGPLVMGGQLISGVEPKNAVGIVALSESVTCLLGVILYFAFAKGADWSLAPYLMLGACASVPLAAKIVNRVDSAKFRFVVIGAICFLGISMIIKSIC